MLLDSGAAKQVLTPVNVDLSPLLPLIPRQQLLGLMLFGFSTLVRLERQFGGSLIVLARALILTFVACSLAVLALQSFRTDAPSRHAYCTPGHCTHPFPPSGQRCYSVQGRIWQKCRLVVRRTCVAPFSPHSHLMTFALLSFRTSYSLASFIRH